MAVGNFATCLKHTLEFEGGWSNHPADPGGATMRGVIQRVYDAYRDRKGDPRRSVRNITEPELQEIYKVNYWDLVKGDSLPAGVDLATFDFGVNSGPGRANQYRNRLGSDIPVSIVKRLCQARLAFVRALGTFSVFGKGWTRRIVTIEARGVKMALVASGQTQAQANENLKTDATKAATKAKQQGTGAAGTAGGGEATRQVDPSIFDFNSFGGWALVIVIGLVAAFLIYLAWTNYQRSQAYKVVAQEK